MRSASPSNASPRSKPPGAHAARRARRGASSRTRSLMLTPSGSAAVISCSMPSCAKTQRRDGRGGAVARSRRARAARAPRSACRRRRRPRPRSARPRPRAARDSPTPAPVGRGAPSPISASTRSSSSSSSLKPSAPNSLMPLSGKGLCEAEMTAPRLAPCSRTSQAMPGVGSTPARSARPPAEAMPAHSASSSIGPERRVSRPTTTTGRSAPRSRANSAEARPSASATSGLERRRRWRRRGRRPCRTAGQP